MKKKRLLIIALCVLAFGIFAYSMVMIVKAKDIRNFHDAVTFIQGHEIIHDDISPTIESITVDEEKQPTTSVHISLSATDDQ